MAVLDYVVVALLALGGFFGLVATLGVLRLPDFYTRTHAASKSETLSAILVLSAVALAISESLPTVKVVLLLVFAFLTNPTAAHAISRAALDEGIEPWTRDGGDPEE
jgi:multicomponent Na+:H+ antiporter subunit G